LKEVEASGPQPQPQPAIVTHTLMPPPHPAPFGREDDIPNPPSFSRLKSN